MRDLVARPRCPSFLAVPPITSSTPRTGPPEGMVRSDMRLGILGDPADAAVGIDEHHVERDQVLRIHIDTS